MYQERSFDRRCHFFFGRDTEIGNRVGCKKHEIERTANAGSGKSMNGSVTSLLAVRATRIKYVAR